MNKFLNTQSFLFFRFKIVKKQDVFINISFISHITVSSTVTDDVTN